VNLRVAFENLVKSKFTREINFADFLIFLGLI